MFFIANTEVTKSSIFLIVSHCSGNNIYILAFENFLFCQMLFIQQMKKILKIDDFTEMDFCCIVIYYPQDNV